MASGAKTDRAQLRRLLDSGDVVTVTRLDRLARSTRDLLNTLATITAKGASFRSLGDAWVLDAHRPWRPGGVRARVDAAQLVRRFYGCAVTALTGSLW